jgi:deoxyribodipyrimidine photo-lyase
MRRVPELQRQLLWREFYAHLAAAFPQVLQAQTEEEGRPNQALSASWTPPPRTDDAAAFTIWSNGDTGVPLVDAAINQLRTTGWLPNRARMVVAVYLCRDLGVDWRRGERFFARHLVDYDPASNSGGWQWAAGAAPEALPSFRTFNPERQARRHDPSGSYVRSFNKK